LSSRRHDQLIREPFPGSAEELAARREKEIVKCGEIVRIAGMKSLELVRHQNVISV
jgi:hypothetical protein